MRVYSVYVNAMREPHTSLPLPLEHKEAVAAVRRAQKSECSGGVGAWSTSGVLVGGTGTGDHRLAELVYPQSFDGYPGANASASGGIDVNR